MWPSSRPTAARTATGATGSPPVPVVSLNPLARRERHGQEEQLEDSTDAGPPQAVPDEPATRPRWAVARAAEA